MGMTRELYEEVMGKVLDAAGVKYFTAREICPVGRTTTHIRTRREVALVAPPVNLLGNILPTLEIADWLREKVGPLIVNSGYRDPEYNAAVGGASNSLHVRFNALDLRSKTVSPRRLYDLLNNRPDAMLFGLGLYQGFVHLDVRSHLCLPAPARWDESRLAA